MQFLTSGDFGFPFSWIFFFLKHFFLWSFQAGAANLDGVIRMPGRLLHLVVFALFGNLAFDYFYLFSSLIIAFVAFFYFAGKVLTVSSVPARLAGSLFFALNPIFLGNLAKVGLILAAAMLPLCLAMVHQAFRTKRFSYFLLWLLFLNISLIHPFTFTVNLVVSGGYFLFLAWHHKKFVFGNIPKLLLVGALAMVMNLYFLLPVASMRTLNKSVLSDTIVSAPTDYTALVDVLNTGDVLTGLSLSRNILLDFEFYNHAYASLYFLGVFLFYLLLFGLFVKFEKQLLHKDRQRFVLLLIAFVTLVVLATVTVFNVSALIKILVQMPGGWTFRSPLKWQLYIPLVLSSMLVILVEYVISKRWRMAVYGGLVASFVLMNGFIAGDIFRKLLTPRDIVYFGELQKLDFQYDSLLLVTGDRCQANQQENPRVMAEFNQIMSSKYAQLKRIGAGDLGLVNLGSYDYIMDCQGVLGDGLAARYDFAPRHSFADGSFTLYANSYAKPYIYPATALTVLDNPRQIDDYYQFTRQSLGSDFDFVLAGQNVPRPTTAVQNIFENLSFKNIKDGAFAVSVAPTHPGSQQLYVVPNGEPMYYAVRDGRVQVGTEPQPGYQPLPDGQDAAIPVEVPRGQKFSLTYADPNYQYQNLIRNPSLEDGTWQEEVGDCYDYDDAPDVKMALDTGRKTDGRQALRLEAGNHIACTGPGEVPVEAGQTYLLNFDYQSPGRAGSYTATFNDPGKTTLQGRLETPGGTWQPFSKIFTAPKDATRLKLLLNAHPVDGGTGAALYDNFKLAAIPDVGNSFYLVGSSSQALGVPQKISYQIQNPTKTTVRVEGAAKPFYLATGETFSDNWRLAPDSSAARSWLPFASPRTVAAADHAQINGSANAWYIDPQALCKPDGACTRNPDGSYSLSLVMEFAPQRWFYLGAILSGAAFAGIIGYLIYDFRRGRGGHYKVRK